MDKRTQCALAEKFLALHDRKHVLVLPNAWDAGSAAMFSAMGFAAIATTSGGMAWSLGYADGENVPLSDLVATIRRIVRLSKVPVTVDFEAGYGKSPSEVAASVDTVIEAGAVGINIEDGVRHESLRDTADAALRIAAARDAARRAGVPIVINARIDTWMVGGDGIDTDRVAETVSRAHAYMAAGADCVYPIGISDSRIIGELCAAIGAPMNIGARNGLSDVAELERLGVARVSLATRLASLAYSAARRAAKRVQDTGQFEDLEADFGYADFQRLLTDKMDR